MSKQNQPLTSQQKKRNKPKNGPHIPAEQVRDQAAKADLIGPAGYSSILGQAARLRDARFPTAQRQSMATQIGRVGGNQYLQNVMDPRTQPGLEVGDVGQQWLAGRTKIGLRDALKIQRQDRDQEEGGEGDVAGSPPVPEEEQRQLFQSATEAYLAGNFEQAIAQFQQLLDLPNLPESARPDLEYNLMQAMRRLFESAVENYVQGNAEQALDKFQRLFELPGLPASSREDMEHNLMQAARRLFEQAAESYVEGRSEQAFRGFRRLLDLPGISGSAHEDMQHNLQQAGRQVFRDAVQAYEGGSYQDAIDRFNLLLETPELPEEVRRDILYNLGMSQLRAGNPGEAIRYLEQYRQMATDAQDIAEVDARLAEARQALGTGGSTPTAEGGETETTGEPSIPEAEQARIFEEALRAYMSGEYSTAYQGFGQLMEAEGVPAFRRQDVLLYRGLTEVRLGIYTMALNHLERYRDMGGPHRDLAEGGMAEALRGMERQRQESEE